MTSPSPSPAERLAQRPSEDRIPMSAAETLAAAREAGLTLVLNDARDAIVAGPPHKITDRIRSSIRRNRDELMRDLLFREAVLYLQQKIDAQRPPPDEATLTAACAVFSADMDAVDEAWVSPDFDAFKAVLRERLRKALAVLTARSRPEGSPKRGVDHRPEASARRPLPEAM